ncbi:hypothetical protein [Helicobacter burdigaliensis]|uniref:hypothetical protein n=1 Tax=Helicobacter burdigaliensis TaxID=2315334 RepID=UPI000EF67171|nr:hypothetical protein [Helicobacter burdigaliensis]
MQIRLLVVIFTIFTGILFFVLIRFYVGAMSAYELPQIETYNFATEQEVNPKEVLKSAWVSRLAMQDKVEYIYPAPEMQVKLMLTTEMEEEQTSKIYRVSVGIIDAYQFFCINQVLSAHKIKYSYYKVGDHIWLLVAANNQNYLHNVLEKLKHYEINYEISLS